MAENIWIYINLQITSNNAWTYQTAVKVHGTKYVRMGEMKPKVNETEFKGEDAPFFLCVCVNVKKKLEQRKAHDLKGHMRHNNFW